MAAFTLGATAKLSGLLDGFATQPNDPRQQRESEADIPMYNPPEESSSEESVLDEELEEDLLPALPDTEEEF